MLMLTKLLTAVVITNLIVLASGSHKDEEGKLVFAQVVSSYKFSNLLVLCSFLFSSSFPF